MPTPPPLTHTTSASSPPTLAPQVIKVWDHVMLWTVRLPTFDRRATATSVKAPPVAGHGVALADVEASQLLRLETRVVRAIWGPTRMARTREVIFCLWTPGHRTLPVMCTRYECLV